MSDIFKLHPRLEADTILLGSLPLSRVLLMNERRYPWIILVPAQPGLTEVAELTEADQAQLIRESSLIANQMRQHLSADKINLAAIGNMVPQLHFHVIARYRDDAAWPAPVWGRFEPEAYSTESRMALVQRLALNEIDLFSPVEA